MLAAALSVASAPAHAEGGEVEACIASSEQGQQQRDDGELLAARQAFLTCARAACPPLLQRDCAGWLADVEARLPSVVLSARDPEGHETAEVQVSVDGAPLFARLDGRAVPLDPGEHLFRFERAGSPAVEQRILVREGEQRRPLAARFSRDALPHAPAASATPARPIPAGVFVLGGVALAGGAAFATLSSIAKSEYDDLQTCKPTCDEADVDAVRVKLWAANAALGVGVAALGAAAVIWLLRPERTAPLAATLAVLPAAGGGAAAIAGRF